MQTIGIWKCRVLICCDSGIPARHDSLKIIERKLNELKIEFTDNRLSDTFVTQIVSFQDAAAIVEAIASSTWRGFQNNGLGEVFRDHDDISRRIQLIPVWDKADIQLPVTISDQNTILSQKPQSSPMKIYVIKSESAAILAALAVQFIQNGVTATVGDGQVITGPVQGSVMVAIASAVISNADLKGKFTIQPVDHVQPETARDTSWDLEDTAPDGMEDDEEDFDFDDDEDFDEDDEEGDDDNDDDDLFEETREDIVNEKLLRLDEMTIAEIKSFIQEQSLAIKTARLRKAELIAAVRAAMEQADDEESQSEPTPEPVTEPTMKPNCVLDTWADFKARNPHVDPAYVDRWVQYYGWAKPSNCLAWFYGNGSWAISHHRQAYDALRAYLGR